MLIFNENFSAPCLKALNDQTFEHFFTVPNASTIESRISVTPDLALNSTILKKVNTTYQPADKTYPTSKVENLFIVTKKFIVALDQFYVKMWNETITEESFYLKENIVSVFKNFNFSYNTDNFKSLVDRMIDNGFMAEEYRLVDNDCIKLSGIDKTNVIKRVDEIRKSTIIEHSIPLKLESVMDRRNGNYLGNQELFFMFTPFSNLDNTYLPMVYDGVVAFKQPYSLFKPKMEESKFGQSIPMGTHVFYKFSSPEERELDILEEKIPADIIFDHTDIISHFDQLRFSIKYTGAPIQGE